MVTIKFHLNLIDYAGNKLITIDNNQSESLENLLMSVGIPMDLVGLTTRNGSWCTINSVPEPGDVFDVFPYMMGG